MSAAPWERVDQFSGLTKEESRLDAGGFHGGFAWDCQGSVDEPGTARLGTAPGGGVARGAAVR